MNNWHGLTDNHRRDLLRFINTLGLTERKDFLKEAGIGYSTLSKWRRQLGIRVERDIDPLENEDKWGSRDLMVPLEHKRDVLRYINSLPKSERTQFIKSIGLSKPRISLWRRQTQEKLIYAEPLPIPPTPASTRILRTKPYTDEDIRLLLEFEALPHGTRKAWLKEHGMYNTQIVLWRKHLGIKSRYA